MRPTIPWRTPPRPPTPPPRAAAAGRRPRLVLVSSLKGPSATKKQSRAERQNLTKPQPLLPDGGERRRRGSCGGEGDRRGVGTAAGRWRAARRQPPPRRVRPWRHGLVAAAARAPRVRRQGLRTRLRAPGDSSPLEGQVWSRDGLMLMRACLWFRRRGSSWARRQPTRRGRSPCTPAAGSWSAPPPKGAGEPLLETNTFASELFSPVFTSCRRLVYKLCHSCRVFKLVYRDFGVHLVSRDDASPLQYVGPQKCLAFSTDGAKFAIGGEVWAHPVLLF
jgi:hypothetical protein